MTDGTDRFEGLDEVTSLDEVYDFKRAGDALAIVALEDTAMREAADVSLYTLTSNIAGARKFSKTTVQDGTRTTGAGNAWGAMQMHAESETSIVYRVPYDDFEEIEDLASPEFTVDPSSPEGGR